jgi:hypothetical protein
VKRKGYNKNAICWVFYCVNDDKEVDPTNPEVMKYVFCYNNLMYAFNPNTKERKWLMTYFKTYMV